MLWPTAVIIFLALTSTLDVGRTVSDNCYCSHFKAVVGRTVSDNCYCSQFNAVVGRAVSDDWSPSRRGTLNVPSGMLLLAVTQTSDVPRKRGGSCYLMNDDVVTMSVPAKVLRILSDDGVTQSEGRATLRTYPNIPNYFHLVSRSELTYETASM